MADQGKQVFPLLIIFLGVLIFTAVVEGIKTSCRIRTSGQTGDLTCAFGENMGETHHSFVVLRYSLNSSQETVLRCNWVSNQLQCNLLDGYEFDRDVGTMITIDMPQLTPEMTGRYLCQVVGNDYKDDEMCEFNYTAAESSTASSGENRTQLGVTGSPESNDQTTVIVLSVFVAFLTVWTVITTVVLVRKKCGARIRTSCGHVIPRQKIRDKKEGDTEQPMLTKDVSEIEEWGRREHLAPEAILALKDEGFTTVDEVRGLTDVEIQECFQRRHKLHLVKYVALKKALKEVSALPIGAQSMSGSSPAYEETNSDKQLVDIDTSCQPPIAVDAGENVKRFRFLLFGKTGSGKSTTGNTILGEEMFTSDDSFGSVTTECKLKRTTRMGKEIEIMDSPGLYDTSRKQEDICKDIVRAVACMHPGPNAILYVVRVGRYTAEEYQVYTRLKALFDENITNFIVVIFTYGDELDRTQKTFADLLNDAPVELRTVLQECNNRSIIFNNMAHNPIPQVEDLLKLVSDMNKKNKCPYVCPKYEEIGKGLEMEVARRLAKVEENELESQKSFQELLKKARQAEGDMRKKKEDIEAKRRLWAHTRKQDEEKINREIEKLRREMEQQKLSEKKRRQEEKAMRDRFAKETQLRMDQMEEQLRKDKEELARKKAEIGDLETEKRRYEEQLNKIKDGIAENKESDFSVRFWQVVFNALSSVFSASFFQTKHIEA